MQEGLGAGAGCRGEAPLLVSFFHSRSCAPVLSPARAFVVTTKNQAAGWNVYALMRGNAQCGPLVVLPSLWHGKEREREDQPVQQLRVVPQGSSRGVGCGEVVGCRQGNRDRPSAMLRQWPRSEWVLWARPCTLQGYQTTCGPGLREPAGAGVGLRPGGRA